MTGPHWMDLASRDDRALAAVAAQATTLLAQRMLETKPEDRLLSVDEAAAQLGLDPKRLMRTWMKYPFATKLSRTDIRFSSVGLQAYVRDLREGRREGAREAGRKYRTRG